MKQYESISHYITLKFLKSDIMDIICDDVINYFISFMEICDILALLKTSRKIKKRIAINWKSLIIRDHHHEKISNEIDNKLLYVLFHLLSKVEKYSVLEM